MNLFVCKWPSLWIRNLQLRAGNCCGLLIIQQWRSTLLTRSTCFVESLRAVIAWTWGTFNCSELSCMMNSKARTESHDWCWTDNIALKNVRHLLLISCLCSLSTRTTSKKNQIKQINSTFFKLLVFHFFKTDGASAGTKLCCLARRDFVRLRFIYAVVKRRRILDFRAVMHDELESTYWWAIKLHYKTLPGWMKMTSSFSSSYVIAFLVSHKILCA